MSSEILADNVSLDVGWGGGPFVPELGATRFVLGQTATIVGRDGPAGALAAVLVSGRPDAPFRFGVSTCALGLDAGSLSVLHRTAQPSFSVALPLPMIPQFAGVELALQSIHAPTSGALGVDLSNALWARIGC